MSLIILIDIISFFLRVKLKHEIVNKLLTHNLYLYPKKKIKIPLL